MSEHTTPDTYPDEAPELPDHLWYEPTPEDLAWLRAQGTPETFAERMARIEAELDRIERGADEVDGLLGKLGVIPRKVAAEIERTTAVGHPE